MSRLAWICLFAVAVSAAPKKPTKVEVTCEGRPDGLYTVGCSQSFTQCYKNIAYKKECPDHLYFNIMYGLCDYNVAVKHCKDPKKVEGKIFQQPEDFSCKNRTDGQYSHPDIPCDKVYYVCNHNHPVRMSCPYNQFFDQENNRCEFEDRVPACKNMKISGTIDAPEGPVAYGAAIKEISEPAAPAPPTPSTDAVQVSITEDDKRPSCKTMGDGVYPAKVEGNCANFFWKCANDVAFKYQCQKDLFYDIEANRCDHKEFTPNCGGKRQITTPEPMRDPSTIDFDCTGKENGNYVKEPCSKIFYNCNEEVVRELTCDADLEFDTRVDRCDYPVSCRNERSTEEPVTGNKVELDDAKTTEAPVDFDCSQKKDGTYAMEKCHTKYIQCSSGSAFEMKCAADLVFSEVTRTCDFLEACKNPVTTTTAAPEPPVTEPATTTEATTTTTTTAGPPSQAPDEVAPAYGSVAVEEESTTTTTTTTITTTTTTEEPTTTTTVAPIIYGAQEVVIPSEQADNTVTETAPLAEINCANLRNGGHAKEPCGNKYVECWDGITHHMECPSGLFYNPYLSSCDYKNNIYDCVPEGKVKFTTTTTAVPAADATVTTAKAQSIDEFCKEKENGFYGNGCSGYFYSCANGITHKMVCPAENYFDDESKQCNDKDSIVACGASPKTTPEPTTTATTVLITTVAPTPVLAKEVPVDSFCKDKETGFYGVGCNDFFYSCNAGNTYKLPCPAGMFYDKEKSACFEKENVPACGAPTTVASAVVEVGGNTPATPVAVDPFCERLSDGFYGYQCNEFFYSCHGGSTSKMNCPAGLFFDIEKNLCSIKEKVAACGAKPAPTTAAVAPEATTVKPAPAYERIVPVRPETKPQKPQVSFDCSNKKDGLFALDECTPIFIQCYNGQTIEQECQQGLFYNVDNGMCDYAEKVKVCGASVAATVPYVEATTTTTAAPAPAHIAADASTLPANATCVGKSDGFYSSGCSASYYACIDGVPTPMRCGDANLRYDGIRRLCDYSDAVEECGGSAPSPTTPPTQPTVPEGAGADPTKRTFTCSGKSDGFYSLSPCSSFYARCDNGVPHVLRCPKNLIFNKEGMKCDYKENLGRCNPATVPTAAPTAPVAVTAAPVVQTTGAPPAPPPTNLPARDAPNYCAGKPNGVFPLGDCSPEFMSCWEGEARSGRCDQNLVFNAPHNYCDIPQRVATCNGANLPPAVLPPQPSHPIAPVGPYAPAARLQPQTTFTCAGKNDGNYGTPCATGFVRCLAQRGYTYTCPSGSVYNANRGICDTVANARC